MRRILLLCGVLLLLLTSAAGGSEKVAEVPLPAHLSAAFDHLLPLVGSSAGGAFEPARVAPLVDFVRGADAGAPLYYEERARRETTSAAHLFAIRTDLQHLLRTAFNPDIPAQVLLPSSLRQAQWTAGANELHRLWNAPLPTQPVIVRAREAEEITPDLITGTYFAYDVDRTLILFAWQGRPVLISLARQKGPSAVGRKGAVLADKEWDYFYSGDKGIARAGLGWVDSYMYEAFSIGVFCESGDGRPLLRAAMFKWLNAGWANVNFVERRHIHDGLVRFAGDLRHLLEHPRLPAPEELAATFARLRRLDAGRLEAFYRRHLQRLEARYGNSKTLAAGFRRQLRDPEQVARAGRREREAALSLDIMKCLLGRECPDATLLAAVRP